MPALRLIVSRNGPQSESCSLSARTGDVATECQATWPNLKEKLRDVLSLGDTELIRMEDELLSTGTTKIEDAEADPARLRALGLEWPVR
jgi:hypothetical protein